MAKQFAVRRLVHVHSVGPNPNQGMRIMLAKRLTSTFVHLQHKLTLLQAEKSFLKEKSEFVNTALKRTRDELKRLK